MVLIYKLSNYYYIADSTNANIDIPIVYLDHLDQFVHRKNGKHPSSKL